MNKADELLNRWVSVDYTSNDENISGEENLVCETLYYLHRKNKLYEGSEWVCDIFGQFGSELIIDEGNEVTVFNVYANHVDTSVGAIYISQFLACFSPKEKAKNETSCRK